MAEFCMPSLGADMDAGTLTEWLKQPGDAVKRGDIIAVVETQKGAIEIEVFEDGVVGEQLIPPGQKVPVGTILARIDGNGGAPTSGARVAPAAVPAPPPPSARAITPPPAPTVVSGRNVLASPAARRLATEKGIDLADIKGTGPNGAIVHVDVKNAAATPVPEPEPVSRLGPDLAGMRKAIGAAMARSKRDIPHYYLSTSIDMSVAHRWLEETNAARPPTERLLMTVLTLKAVAHAVLKVSGFNGFFGDGGYQTQDAVHIGTAISLRGGGLIAPALHDCGTKSVDEIMTALKDLTTRARAGSLRSSELMDSTITVTSLGERGVEGIFGIIYPPQVAIIGLGRIVERPWAVAGKLEVRPVMQATLAADHRVTDGHAGARLLSEIDKLLQKPEAL